jgi:hypothetical protein
MLGWRAVAPILRAKAEILAYLRRRRTATNAKPANTPRAMLDGSGTTLKRLVPLAESRADSVKRNSD